MVDLGRARGPFPRPGGDYFAQRLGKGVGLDTLTIGGSVPAVASMSEPEPTIVNLIRPKTAYLLTAPTPNPTPTPVPVEYTYTLDADNPHHATASGTPVGDLNIRWQVRQGAITDVRYVTINVTQINPPANLANGFTVTTMIVRN